MIKKEREKFFLEIIDLILKEYVDYFEVESKYSGIFVENSKNLNDIRFGMLTLCGLMMSID